VAKAEVSSSQPGIGMGIEFIDLDYDQKRMIQRLIEEIRLEADRDFTL
jgi:hypothetical protein